MNAERSDLTDVDQALEDVRAAVRKVPAPLRATLGGLNVDDQPEQLRPLWAAKRALAAATTPDETDEALQQLLAAAYRMPTSARRGWIAAVFGEPFDIKSIRALVEAVAVLVAVVDAALPPDQQATPGSHPPAITGSPRVDAAAHRLAGVMRDLPVLHRVAANQALMAAEDRTAELRPMLVALARLAAVLAAPRTVEALRQVVAAAQGMRPAARRAFVTMTYSGGLPDLPWVQALFDATAVLVAAVDREAKP